MKKIVLSIIGFVIFLFILTNPSEEKHEKAFMSKINTSSYNSITEPDDDWGRAGQAFGNMIGDALVIKVVSADNYIFFSVTKINYGGSSRIVGMGILGVVIITEEFE